MTNGARKAVESAKGDYETGGRIAEKVSLADVGRVIDVLICRKPGKEGLSTGANCSQD